MAAEGRAAALARKAGLAAGSSNGLSAALGLGGSGALGQPVLRLAEILGQYMAGRTEGAAAKFQRRADSGAGNDLRRGRRMRQTQQQPRQHR